jgi:hypothetical protein
MTRLQKVIPEIDRLRIKLEAVRAEAEKVRWANSRRILDILDSDAEREDSR